MAERAALRATAARIAAFGLREDDRIEPTADAWSALLGMLEVERLIGLAGAADAAGSLAIGEAQREELREARIEVAMRALTLERFLLRFVEEARADGIEPVVLKGTAWAHRFYPDPAHREFHDLDILVHTGDWRRACALLDRLGLKRDLPEPRAGFDERFGKAATHTSKDGVCVDLHRTLVLGAFGVWLDPERLFDETVPFDIAGVRLRRLNDTTALLHACMHASLGWSPPLLMPLRDVAQIAREGEVDWDRFGERAERWRLGAVVRHSFAAVQETLGVQLPDGAISAAAVLRSTPRERRALATYVGEKRKRGGTMRSTFWAVHGLRAKTALIRDVALPSRAFLAARAGREDRPSYAKRFAIPLRWLLGRSR